jgi:hypothetical protein
MDTDRLSSVSKDSFEISEMHCVCFRILNAFYTVLLPSGLDCIPSDFICSVSYLIGLKLKTPTPRMFMLQPT